MTRKVSGKKSAKKAKGSSTLKGKAKKSKFAPSRRGVAKILAAVGAVGVGTTIYLKRDKIKAALEDAGKKVSQKIKSQKIKIDKIKNLA